MKRIIEVKVGDRTTIIPADRVNSIVKKEYTSGFLEPISFLINEHEFRFYSSLEGDSRWAAYTELKKAIEELKNFLFGDCTYNTFVIDVNKKEKVITPPSATVFIITESSGVTNNVKIKNRKIKHILQNLTDRYEVRVSDAEMLKDGDVDTSVAIRLATEALEKEIGCGFTVDDAFVDDKDLGEYDFSYIRYEMF